ncbi:MAG: YqfO family protein [Gammaproteobacteria bacterium]|nr:YqfO family protein [Gammaproteobacteria bacterium]
MYKICIYVPENAVDKVKQAVFDAGAGRVGNYDRCCWQTEGTGQFRPLENSNPAIGSRNRINQVKELKVELVCADNLVKAAILALKHSHPYEEPAYDVWKLEEL